MAAEILKTMNQNIPMRTAIYGMAKRPEPKQQFRKVNDIARLYGIFIFDNIFNNFMRT